MPIFKHEIAPIPGQPLELQTKKPQILDKDREDLEEKIEKIEEKLESLGKMLIRSSESRLHNKVNEIQEEICQRQYDLNVAQIHLSAVRAQLQLFEYNFRPRQAASNLASSLGLGSGSGVQFANSANIQGSDQMIGAGGSISSSAATGASGSESLANAIGQSASGSSSGTNPTGGGYKNKWIKAFKSLKGDTPNASATNSQMASGARRGDQMGE